MANKIHIEIVCPDEIFYSADADMLVVRTFTGDMAIMNNHEPHVTPIKVGSFKIIDGDEKKTGAMARGFLHVDSEKVTVITDSVEWSDEIDEARAKEAKKRAEERLRDKSNIDVKRAEYALKKAANRIRISKNG